MRRTLLWWEVPFGAFGAALVVCAFVFSLVGIPSWIPQAPLVRAGIPSPFSGMTRSFVAFASGDVGAAFAWHPLGPLVFALCAGLALVAIASWVRGRRFDLVVRVASVKTTWFVVCTAVVVTWARQIAVLG